MRDWLHVSDHCRALELILQAGKVGEIYNIGGRAEVENLQLVRSLCEIAGQMFESQPQLRSRYPHCPREDFADLIRFVADRPGHDRRYSIDCARIEQELGFAPRVKLPDGLRDTFAWYVNNESWWRAAPSQNG